MSQSQAKKIVEEIAQKVDIKFDGSRPWDVIVKNDKLYQRVLNNGSLGLGESYMDGWWECQQLDELFYRMFKANLWTAVSGNWQLLLHAAGEFIFNPQRKSKAFEIGQRHYDIGNDLYKAMLDKRMVYTCGYWKNAKTLDQAQEDKLDLVCQKIGLQAGQKVLDIGCGWGSFAKFAAEKYKAQVVGITVAKKQVELARQLCQGLPVEISLQDYRDVKGTFDHIVSLGMIEHVGYKNYRTYMQLVHDHLADDGLFLLQTIGTNQSVHASNPWFERYIFPNSMLPSVAQLGKAAEGLLIMEDWHNFGADYDKTLQQWYKNFEANWPQLKANYDERFRRMWKYYLQSTAGGFRARTNQLWQVVWSKKGVAGGYKSIR